MTNETRTPSPHICPSCKAAFTDDGEYIEHMGGQCTPSLDVPCCDQMHGDLWNGSTHIVTWRNIHSNHPDFDSARIARLATRTPSPHGDAGDALDWALDHHDASDALDFLEAWREGRADEEPGYIAWVALQHRCAAESRAARTPDENDALLATIARLNAKVERAGQRILILLGGYRDEMHPEAVDAFQNLAKDLAALAPKEGVDCPAVPQPAPANYEINWPLAGATFKPKK